MSNHKDLGQIHWCVTLINLLIKTEPKNFCILTEQFILEDTALQIRWKSKRPELNDLTGDCVLVAHTSGLFPNDLQFSRKGRNSAHTLGRLIGLCESETNEILQGFRAHRTYGKSDIDVTPQDVALKLIQWLYDMTGFNSMDVESEYGVNGWANVSLPEDIPDFMWQNICNSVNSGRLFKFNYKFGVGHGQRRNQEIKGCEESVRSGIV